MLTKITGPTCPSCGRDNEGFGNVCTSDDCPGISPNLTQREYIEILQRLLAALEKAAWFIENVNEDTPDRTSLFFETREAWRNAIAQAKVED
jgi:hypothetical protein